MMAFTHTNVPLETEIKIKQEPEEEIHQEEENESTGGFVKVEQESSGNEVNEEIENLVTVKTEFNEEIGEEQESDAKLVQNVIENVLIKYDPENDSEEEDEEDEEAEFDPLKVSDDDPRLAYAYKCLKCEYRTNSSLLLRAHVSSKIHKNKPPTKVPVKKKVLWSCPKCAEKFVTRKKLVSHQKSYHRFLNLYHCSFCDFRCKTKPPLKAHVKRFHPDANSLPSSIVNNKKQFQCQGCDFSSNRESILTRHKETYHDSSQNTKKCVVKSEDSLDTKVRDLSSPEKEKQRKNRESKNFYAYYQRRKNRLSGNSETSNGTRHIFPIPSRTKSRKSYVFENGQNSIDSLDLPDSVQSTLIEPDFSATTTSLNLELGDIIKDVKHVNPVKHQHLGDAVTRTEPKKIQKKPNVVVIEKKNTSAKNEKCIFGKTYVKKDKSTANSDTSLIDQSANAFADCNVTLKMEF